MKTSQTTDASAEIAETRRLSRASTFAALRHRNFQLYFGGQLISVAGTWLQIIAQGWLVYQLTRSELALGIVSFASAIPVLVVSPFGGVLVDRVPKRNLLVITQTASMLLALILALLTFTNVVQEWHVILLAAALGLVNAFDAPARQAFVVEMVGREDLTNAIALNSLMFNGGRIIGPAAGGLLLAALGPAWCFLINGISFLAVIAGLLAMRLPPHVAAPHTQVSSLKQLAGGFRYSKEVPEIMALLVLALIFSVFGIAYSSVLPAFIDRVLHAGASAYGAVNAFSGIGAVTAALLIASQSLSGGRGRWLFRANLVYCALLLVFAFNQSYLLALILAFGLGVGFMMQFTLMNTLLQLRVDDVMRGRVLSLYTLCIFGLAPFGALAMGSLSETWGLSPTIGLSAVITAVLSLAVFLWVPKVRQLI